VYDNMAFGLKLRKYKKADIEQRVREAADILGITDLLKRRPKALSGGQRQRVAVGRAIVRKPAAFLLDEPLSNLDAKMRVQMRAELSKLHDRLETTMIYVTHDQVEAMTMGDRICVMKDGIIQQVADPITLYDQPANRFVAGFIGTPPMNFFTGHLERKNGHAAFRSGGVHIPLPPAWNDALAPYTDKAVLFGLRPEDIGSPRAETDPGAPAIRSRIDVVEPMGSESYLYLSAEDNAFVARVDAHRSVRVGDTIDLKLCLPKAHVFDPHTQDLVV
jgi:multiple sugar transport system ATP-binding protein